VECIVSEQELIDMWRRDIWIIMQGNKEKNKTSEELNG